MANLEALIRVRRHAVEQKQKFLAELYRQVEAMQQQKSKLENDLINERKVVDELGTAEAIAYYGRYSIVARNTIEHLNHEMKKLETRIDIAREDMRAAYAEQKKVEITQKRRQDRAAAEARKKEDKELDEIGIEGFRRKDGEE